MFPADHVLSMTFDSTGEIVGIAIRQGWTDEATPGNLVADVVLDRDSGLFRPGEDLAASGAMPEWVGPFLDSLGAPKQQNAVSGLIEGQLVA